MNKRILRGYGLEIWVYMTHLNTTYCCLLSGPGVLDLYTPRGGKYFSPWVSASLILQTRKQIYYLFHPVWFL